MTLKEEILSVISKAATELDAHLMLVGAYSRDYWIRECGVCGNARKTMDVDLACWVSSWEEFNQIMGILTSRHGLRQDARIKHRLWLRDEIYADLIPFGGIEDANGEFAWPPNFDVTLNVLGYQVAYAEAAVAQIGSASIRVISPCWLAMLKLKAYTENPDRTKDLIDVYFIVDHYLEFIDEDRRLYGPEATDADVFGIEPFDTRVAGATLIVRDCNAHGGEILKSIQDDLRAFDADDALSVVFTRVNSIEQDVTRRLLEALLTPIQ